IHNLYDEASTSRVWEGPFQAESVEALLERLDLEFKNIPKDAKVILLGPKETVLAHTQEFIGGRDICVAKMYARSSMGRNFVEVCKDAGWGDVGYFNRWTMEVTNNSQYYTIPLVVGRRIAQMVFYQVAPLEKREVDYVGEGGKYQRSQDLAELKKSWNPMMMLPQMHLDWEVAAMQSELPL
ncbi:MAG: dCTP deaminase, partial [Parcubacteria group bacterium GW2011_GWA1_59_11]